jgi:hypothetical protein
MLWDIAIFATTVIGIRHKELSTKSNLWRALVKQGIGYVFATALATVPITASVGSLIALRH